jgi:hypothetical protein
MIRLENLKALKYVNFNLKHWLYYFVPSQIARFCGLPELM